jgi:hypothetical protein
MNQDFRPTFTTKLPARGHFCLDLHVAMQFRPYHHPFFNGAFVVVVGVGDKEPPNLLIVRTGQIVTAHANTIFTRCNASEYCQILGCSSIRRRFYLIRFPVIRPTFVKATAPVKLPT